MTYFSQLDPRWRYIKIPGSSYNIGQIGCTMTCASMILDRQPNETVNEFKFVNGGLLVWSSILGFKWIKRSDQLRKEGYYTDRNSETRKLIIDLFSGEKKRKTGVIISYQQQGVPGGQHWVAIEDIAIGGYIVNDPWRGQGQFVPLSKVINIVLIEN